MSDTFKIDTRVVNTETGQEGRVVCYYGDYSEYAIRYDSVEGYHIYWVPAEKVVAALVHPELPLKRRAL